MFARTHAVIALHISPTTTTAALDALMVVCNLLRLAACFGWSVALVDLVQRTMRRYREDAITLSRGCVRSRLDEASERLPCSIRHRLLLSRLTSPYQRRQGIPKCPLVIAPMSPAQQSDFASIWIPWLRDTMGRTPEAEDLAVMADPAAYYRATGGEAFLASLDGKIVGAVAVKGLGSDGFEFCKLVVTEAARGHGAGRALVQNCLDFAAEQGGPALYLQSFNALDIALGLYRRMGFVDAAAPAAMTVLARTEVIMMQATAAQEAATAN